MSETIDEPTTIHDDLLWQHLKTLPAFRALLRAVEARFYQQLEFPGPVLDIGCGDGNFTELTFAQTIEVGIDPWWGPLQKARRSGKYELVLQNAGAEWPFPDHTFATAYSNSVLEHIPDIQSVLNEAGRVLRPGGHFVMTMPSHLFTEYLGGAGFFERLGLPGAANKYRDFFNFISRHAHTDPPEMWAGRLAQAGFRVVRWQYYFSKGALRALEIGHVQGVPSAVLHALTGQWILAPWEENLRYTDRWLRPFFEEPFPEQGAYIFIVAEKVADGPIEAELPEQRPFSLEDLNRDWRLEISGSAGEAVGAGETAVSAHTPPPTPNLPIPQSPISNPQSPNLPTPPSPAIPALFTALCLLFAVVGQSSLLADPAQPGVGLRWFGFSALALLALIWYRRPQTGENGRFSLTLPKLADIPSQRWLVFAGLLLSLLAQKMATGGQRPLITLPLWLFAILITAYALWQPLEDRAYAIRPYDAVPLFPRSPAPLLPLLLFLTALLLRALALTSHPFILNGSEASIGLDALNVARGNLTNPFATAWLTNPTLPAFLLSLPIRLLGPSVLSVRLLSPLVGAATVVAVYAIGRRLWNERVGLVAAVLLAGSHYHLHFSRLGLTNIWDPLLTLLALGLVALAWERQNRLGWLLAGTAVGVNAYFYTSTHLLPLMLLPLLLLAGWYDRAGLWRQKGHILAAALLALVIALPQMVYYNTHWQIFMERANVLGILGSQSGWLAQEAARTGQSQTAVFAHQFWQAALGYTVTLDTSPSYRPMVPLIGFIPSVLLVVGVITAVFHFRQLRHQLLLIWVAVTIIFAGALLDNPPNAHRLLIALPAVMLLTAVGLNQLLTLIWPTDPTQANSPISNLQSLLSTPHALLLTLLLLLTTRDLTFYFGTYRQATPPTFADRNTEIADGVADYLNTLDGDWTAYFYGPPSMYVSFPTIPFLAQAFEAGTNLFDVDATDASLPPAATPHRVFIFLPERSGEISAVQTQFPDGNMQFIEGAYATPLFFAYEVP
ncbi:MAG: glycosyltransferase family 39 protein [Chloroflexota bacterium]